MEIKPVADILLENALMTPILKALIPNEDNYTVLALQPHGDIVASAEGVRSRDRDLATKQFGKFLEYAKEKQADLVITPEYSMPWEVLSEAISGGNGPVQGKLWAVGCESIKISELESLKERLASFATVIYEPLDASSTRFVSPLAYIFVSPPASDGGEAEIVVLVQFKTHPMGDPDHFEINGMQRGIRIYQFGGNEQNLKLVSLICADTFVLNDEIAAAIHDRALILHIQLNPNPRHESFLSCRAKLLQYSGDATEVLCLNWSEDVKMSIGGHDINWKNIAGSAWYLKTQDFDDNDITLCNNHRQGLYYTWLEPHRSHALFFNYKPAIFLFTATKVAHVGVAGPVSKRRGPQLIKTCNWNDHEGSWDEKSTADDGFSAVIKESGNAQTDIERIADVNPLDVERILALCAGEIKSNEDWHKVRLLDSCVIDSSEIIQRVTFAQDTHEKAIKFRTARLKRCSHLWEIIKNEELPPALSDIKSGFCFKWSYNSPHQNVESTSGKLATVIYMGEECRLTDIEAIEKRVAQFLYASSLDEFQSRSAKQRFHVWFRDASGAVIPYKPNRYVMIDQTDNRSPVDIGREE